jgi:hypothetical protein
VAAWNCVRDERAHLLDLELSDEAYVEATANDGSLRRYSPGARPWYILAGWRPCHRPFEIPSPPLSSEPTDSLGRTRCCGYKSLGVGSTGFSGRSFRSSASRSLASGISSWRRGEWPKGPSGSPSVSLVRDVRVGSHVSARMSATRSGSNRWEGMNHDQARLPVTRGTRLTRLHGILAVVASCPMCRRELASALDPRPIMTDCRCGARVEIDPVLVLPTVPS